MVTKGFKILFILFIFTPFFLNAQGVDTISLIVPHPSGKNFNINQKKIYIKKEDGTLIKNRIKVSDSIMSLNYTTSLYVVYLKLYNKNGVLYSSGLWNEEGYQSKIYFYKRNGDIKFTGEWKNGIFIKEENE